MNIGHIADVHLGHRQYGIKQRELDMYLTFESVLNRLEEDGVDFILLPGDLFDTRDLKPSVLSKTEDILSDVDVPVLVSPGNHDQRIYPREVTWLRYLHEKGHIILLESDLSEEVANFERVEIDSPNDTDLNGRYVNLESSNLEKPLRVFGLQWRGAYTDTALKQVAEGIKKVNDNEGEPLHTVLMGHFGVEEMVPDLGPNISFPDLDPLDGLVDYLALGHIHKQYEAEDWLYNPGSPEAMDVQEGRWSEKHGYYLIDLDEDDVTVEHHLSKRRPYETVEFSVTDIPTMDEMKSELRNRLDEKRDDIQETQNKDIHKAGGDTRSLMLNLRLTGTLLLDRTTFGIEELESVLEEELDVLHVQTTDTTETKDLQELLDDSEEDVLEDGEINHEVLKSRVFEKIAEESQYSADSEGAAETVGQVETLVNREDEPMETVAEYVQTQRRTLFPDGAETATGASDPQNNDEGEGGDSE